MIYSTRPKSYRWLVLAMLVITAIAIMAGAFFIEQTPEYIKGPYTYEQELVEADGSVVRAYASGDQYYNYLHDKDGFILTYGEDGNVYYAVEKGGRPTPSNVRYTSPEYLVNSLEKMGYDDIDFGANPELVNSYYDADTVESAPLLSSASSTTAKNIYNITILIDFPGEDSLIVQEAKEDALSLYGNDDGEVESIRSFYKDMTDGQVLINNCYAYTDAANSKVFVYTAPEARSYYNVPNGTLYEKTRKEKEGALITGAIAAFNQQLYKGSYDGADFDVNDDGYFDSVCFILLCDTASNSWGNLLWPHKWNTSALVGLENSSKMTDAEKTISIGNTSLKCGDYSFSFGYTAAGTYDFAVACHEMGHVFSAPDYYSYKTGVSYDFAGLLDLMGSTTDKTAHPSYMTAYTRDRYLKSLKGYVESVSRAQSGITLTAATEATATDRVAIKIPTPTEGVYIYVEYRSNDSPSTYDNSIGGRGVIVYRVNENVDGNTEAGSGTDYSNIELYVYRTGSDIANAFLTTTTGRNYFSNLSLGATTLDVTIKVTAMTATTATIELSGSGLNNALPVDDDYFLDKVSVTSADYVLDEDNVKFGVDAVVSLTDDIDLSKLVDMSVSLVDGSGASTHTMTADREVFVAAFDGGQRDFAVHFDCLADGDEYSFSGAMINTNTPVAVTVSVTDTDMDAISIPDATRDIATDSYLWENVVNVCRFYDLFAIYLNTPYLEAKQGATFAMPALYVRSGSGASFGYSYQATDAYITINNNNIATVAADATLGYHYVEYTAQSIFGGRLTTTLTINVVEEYHSFEPVTASSTAIAIGTPWESISTTVSIGGVDVPLSNTTPLSYDPNSFVLNDLTNNYEQEVKFLYQDNYYVSTIEIADVIMTVNLGTPSFEVFPGEDSIPATTPVALYYWSGKKLTGTLSQVEVNYTLPDIASTAYTPVEYTVSYEGASATSHFAFFRVSVVQGSITPVGNTLVDSGVEYYVASETASGVDYSGFSISITLNRGSGRVTYSATKDGTAFSIVNLPIQNGDYRNREIIVRYIEDGANYSLGSIYVDFRILKTATNISVISSYTSGDGSSASPIAFYLDELASGKVSFSFKIDFGASDSETVAFDLGSRAAVAEGLFSFSSSEWGLSKTFYFYGVDVVASLDLPSDSYYGESLPATYQGVSYLGTPQTYAPQIGGYNTRGTIGVAQNVTFSLAYNSETTSHLPYERTVSITKKISTIDGVYSLSKAQLTSTTFDYEEQMDVSNLELLTYKSYYNHHNGIADVVSADLDKASFSTLDYSVLTGTTRESSATLTITYADKTIDVPVKLVNGIVSQRITDYGLIKDALYKPIGGASISYSLTYANGTFESVTVPFGEYTKVDGTAFRCDNLGLHKVRVYNPLLPTEELTSEAKPLNVFVYMYATEVVGLLTPSRQAVTTVSIAYGDVLDLTGYILQYTQNGSNGELSLKRNYYRYAMLPTSKFASLDIAVVSLSEYLYNPASSEVPISIKARVDDEVLAVKEGAIGIEIDHKRGLVTLSDSMSKVALRDALTTHSRFSLKHPDVWTSEWAGGYELVGTKKQLYTISVYNRDNMLVEAYKVIVKGDGNGDGIRDLSDLESFAQALLTGSDEYLDSFSAGSTFSLEDFVKQIVDRKNEGQSSPLPVAELFVCEYRGKEDETC